MQEFPQKVETIVYHLCVKEIKWLHLHNLFLMTMGFKVSYSSLFALPNPRVKAITKFLSLLFQNSIAHP